MSFAKPKSYRLPMVEKKSGKIKRRRCFLLGSFLFCVGNTMLVCRLKVLVVDELREVKLGGMAALCNFSPC